MKFCALPTSCSTMAMVTNWQASGIWLSRLVEGSAMDWDQEVQPRPKSQADWNISLTCVTWDRH